MADLYTRLWESSLITPSERAEFQTLVDSGKDSKALEEFRKLFVNQRMKERDGKPIRLDPEGGYSDTRGDSPAPLAPFPGFGEKQSDVTYREIGTISAEKAMEKIGQYFDASEVPGRLLSAGRGLADTLSLGGSEALFESVGIPEDQYPDSHTVGQVSGYLLPVGAIAGAGKALAAKTPAALGKAGQIVAGGAASSALDRAGRAVIRGEDPTANIGTEALMIGGAAAIPVAGSALRGISKATRNPQRVSGRAGLALDAIGGRQAVNKIKSRSLNDDMGSEDLAQSMVNDALEKMAAKSDKAKGAVSDSISRMSSEGVPATRQSVMPVADGIPTETVRVKGEPRRAPVQSAKPMANAISERLGPTKADEEWANTVLSSAADPVGDGRFSPADVEQATVILARAGEAPKTFDADALVSLKQSVGDAYDGANHAQKKMIAEAKKFLDEVIETTGPQGDALTAAKATGYRPYSETNTELSRVHDEVQSSVDTLTGTRGVKNPRRQMHVDPETGLKSERIDDKLLKQGQTRLIDAADPATAGQADQNFKELSKLLGEKEMNELRALGFFNKALFRAPSARVSPGSSAWFSGITGTAIPRAAVRVGSGAKHAADVVDAAAKKIVKAPTGTPIAGSRVIGDNKQKKKKRRRSK